MGVPWRQQHRLSERDLTTRTAVCSQCGPTRLVRIARDLACVSAPHVRARLAKDADKRRHGVSGSVVRALVVEVGHCQNRACAKPLEVRTGGHALDHDHATGMVRGLLCIGCNRALAVLDDPVLLAGLVTYLADAPHVVIPTPET